MRLARSTVSGASGALLVGAVWLAALAPTFAAAQPGTECPGEVRFPEAVLFLESAGYPADHYAVLLTWQEPIPADESGEMVNGYRVQPRAGGEPFDVYSDGDGYLLNQETRAVLGIKEKNWALRPVQTATESRPGASKAARTTGESLRVASAVAASAMVGFPPLDMMRVREADRKRDLLPGAKPRRIGLFRDFSEPVQLTRSECSAGAWQPLDGGRLWSIDVYSADAEGLRVHFQELRLPPDARLIAFNPEDPAESYGPFTPSQMAADGFWTPTCFGDTVAIECYLPAKADTDDVAIVIDRLAHIYEKLGDLPWAKSAGSCNLDVTCYPAWGTTATGVGGLGTIGHDGALWCTGTLLADTDPATDIPYFMAADHCAGSQAIANALEIYWLYQTPTCNGTAPNPSTVPRTTGGADYLAGSTADGGTDFAFLRLRNAPPGEVAFVGWASDPASVGTDAVCVHHPAGDFKRISFGPVTNIADSLRAFRPIERYHQVQWAQGTTEGGSSGSPLMREDTQQFIGQLWGGGASCLEPLLPDYYGRFDVTFPLVQAWLAPSGQELSVLPANQYVAAESGATSFAIDDAGAGTLNWSAEVTVGSGWLSISPPGSGTTPATLNVSYAENLTAGSRTGYIQVADVAKGSPVVVGVIQAAATTPILSVAPSNRDAPATSGTTTFAIDNTGAGTLEWTAAVDVGAPWLAISGPDSGTGPATLAVAYIANPGDTLRVGTVTVTGSGALNSPTAVTVTQNGIDIARLATSPDTRSVAYTSGVTTFSVSNVGTAAMNWTASIVSAADWLYITSGASGTDDGTIVVAYETNPLSTPRSAAIEVAAPGALDAPAQVTVAQEADPTPVLSVTPAMQPIGHTGGTVAFAVSGIDGSVAWTAAVAGNSGWLTITSGDAGAGPGTIVVDCETNTGQDSRTGYISVSAPGTANSPVTVAVDQDCEAPAAPAGVAASDGAFPDRVRITWNPVSGATAYRVYRGDTDALGSAVYIGQWYDTIADDYSVVPGGNGEETGGCMGSSTGGDPSIHHYWVTAVNACSEGGPSLSDQGYAGAAAKASGAVTTWAKVLPGTSAGTAGLFEANPMSPLFIRLRAAEAIDPGAVWARVTGPDVDTDLAFWIPVMEGDDRDGWVACWPDESWPIGVVLTMTAGGDTVSGVALQPAVFRFTVTVSALPAGGFLTLTEADESLAELAQGVGPAYRIEPDALFLEPHLVWVPVPAGLDPGELQLYFHQAVGWESGWYAGDMVDGWLDASEPVLSERDGVMHMGFVLHHGATARLGFRVETGGTPNQAGVGNALLLLALPLCLTAAAALSRARNGRPASP
jgi:Viral BACON domain/Trypsin-like peptidase domain